MNRILLHVFILLVVGSLNAQDHASIYSDLGQGTFNGKVLTIGIQTDAKMVVGGTFTKFQNNPCNRLV